MAITERKTTGAQGSLSFSQTIPEVTLALGQGQTPGVQRGTTVILRASWTTPIAEHPQGFINWDATYGEPGSLIPMSVASAGSQAEYDITISLSPNSSAYKVFSFGI